MRKRLIKFLKKPILIWMLSLCSAVLVSAAYGIIFERQASGHLNSDLLPHLSTVSEVFSNPSSYPLFPFCVLTISKTFHLDIKNSAIALLMFSILSSAIILGVVLKKKLEKQYSWPLIGIFISALMCISAIYLPEFSEYIYIGSGSPNTIHNPTLIFAKPFSFISVYFFCWLFSFKKEPISTLTVATCFVLILGALAKPNFGLAFLFSGPLFILLRRNALEQNIQRLLAVISPLMTLLIVLWVQYCWQYVSGSASGTSIEDGIIIDLLGVARLFSPNPFISLILLVAFPIATVIFYPSILKDDLFILSLLTFLVSIAQYWILAESGPRYAHGNFGWALEIIVPMVFVICMAEVLNRSQSVKTKLDLFKISITLFIFAGHLISGLLYFNQLMTTSSYF